MFYTKKVVTSARRLRLGWSRFTLVSDKSLKSLVVYFFLLVTMACSIFNYKYTGQHLQPTAHYMQFIQFIHIMLCVWFHKNCRIPIQANCTSSIHSPEAPVICDFLPALFLLVTSVYLMRGRIWHHKLPPLVLTRGSQRSAHCLLLSPVLNAPFCCLGSGLCSVLSLVC